jgi:hypothetical protein
VLVAIDPQRLGTIADLAHRLEVARPDPARFSSAFPRTLPGCPAPAHAAFSGADVAALTRQEAAGGAWPIWAELRTGLPTIIVVARRTSRFNQGPWETSRLPSSAEGGRRSTWEGWRLASGLVGRSGVYHTAAVRAARGLKSGAPQEEQRVGRGMCQAQPGGRLSRMVEVTRHGAGTSSSELPGADLR